MAGFTEDQHKVIAGAIWSGAGATHWETAANFDDADAWCLNGARTQALGNGRIRVAAGKPNERSLQLHLPDVDRPIAFAEPLPPAFKARCSFNPDEPGSMKAVLQRFDEWFAPSLAQFCLGSHIVEHQSALGAGKFELCVRGDLLAIVDMHGDAAVRATAVPPDFEEAVWRRADTAIVPENFVRASLSQVMWQYALRTQRDVLPKHYRTGLLYFRRAPRLPQNLLKDSHLLLLRELMLTPGTFADLQQRCGMDDMRLARELAALYFVGSITSNPKRAGRVSDSGTRTPYSMVDSIAPNEADAERVASAHDLTAPAPVRPDH